MSEAPERPDAAGGEPAGQSGGAWLPPVAPGQPPPVPPGWRISPKATDAAPDLPDGPQPWADPGNPTASVALGLSVAAFGAVWFFFPLAIPLGIPGTILAVVARRRVRSGETREGRAFVDVALWV